MAWFTPRSRRSSPARSDEARPRVVIVGCGFGGLEAAKALDLNISQVCDTYLRELVRQEQERRWRQEHADFVSAYNATIEAEGLPLDEWRSF